MMLLHIADSTDLRCNTTFSGSAMPFVLDSCQVQYLVCASSCLSFGAMEVLGAESLVRRGVWLFSIWTIYHPTNILERFTAKLAAS